jgi:hypothetical protein
MITNVLVAAGLTVLVGVHVLAAFPAKKDGAPSPPAKLDDMILN